MIPEAPAQDHRQQRHSPKTIKLARVMYADGYAWTPSQIVKYIREVGITPVPHVTTVRIWVVPGVWEARADMRARRRALKRPVPVAERPAVAEERLTRMRELRAAGMSFSGIAVLARVDFGCIISPDIARDLVQGNPRPKTLARHLTPSVPGRGSSLRSSGGRGAGVGMPVLASGDPGQGQKS